MPISKNHQNRKCFSKSNKFFVFFKKIIDPDIFGLLVSIAKKYNEVASLLENIKKGGGEFEEVESSGFDNAILRNYSKKTANVLN